jgi:flavin-dependent dehydrogenase
MVVVGYGFAGAAAAIEVHDLGADIVLVEKNATPGGISICSAGGVRIAKDRDAALAYLQDTGHRDVEVMDPITQTHLRIPSWLILDATGFAAGQLGLQTYNDARQSFI